MVSPLPPPPGHLRGTPGLHPWPPFFRIYMLPLGNVIRRHGVNFHMYSDDTQIYFASCSTNSRSPDVLTACLADIKAWRCVNFLKLNMDKTEAILLGSCQHLHSCGSKVLNLPGLSLRFIEPVRNLGVHFDPQLSFLPHIRSLTRTAFFPLHHIVCLGPYLPQMQQNPSCMRLSPPAWIRRSPRQSPQLHYSKNPVYSELCRPHTDPDQSPYPHLTGSGPGSTGSLSLNRSTSRSSLSCSNPFTPWHLPTSLTSSHPNPPPGASARLALASYLSFAPPLEVLLSATTPRNFVTLSPCLAALPPLSSFSFLFDHAYGHFPPPPPPPARSQAPPLLRFLKCCPAWRALCKCKLSLLTLDQGPFCLFRWMLKILWHYLEKKREFLSPGVLVNNP
uniref:Reverse transcriptase domain-containing protein n=1 Tax=Callorhinchus milii TaxID=7868 RepID=A0A4W3HJM1_CALMI